MSETKIKKSAPVKDKIRIKNAKNLFKDINDGAKQVVIDYNKRDKYPNKFKRTFKEKIFNRLSTSVILSKKYEETGKNKKSVKQVLKLIVYTLLAITMIAVTNLSLLKVFSSSIKEYIETSPDIKDRGIVKSLKDMIDIFTRKLEQVSILQRLLMGTVFINTLVNKIPSLYEDAGRAISQPFFEMLKTMFTNLVSVENTMKDTPKDNPKDNKRKP